MRTRVRTMLVLAACVVSFAGPAVADAGPMPPRDHDGSPLAPPANTSDNEPGQVAAPLPRAARVSPPKVIRRYRVSPGVIEESWTQTDARGPIRAHLLRINTLKRGVRIDYADAGSVRSVATVKKIIAVDKSVAGINGDFYDIGRTGAPLGIGKDRQRKLIHGHTLFPCAAFYLGPKGRGGVGDLTMRVWVRQHPEIHVDALNSPTVPPDGITVYTPRWGRTAGYEITDGQRTGVWAVRTDTRGRVVAVGSKLRADRKLRGNLYVGRGRGAEQLRTLRKGMVAKPAYGLGGPAVVITGNKILAQDGVVRVTDDRDLHPRTAVGVDRDKGQVLMLVVDGRSRTSRGYTMVELAKLMISLGADDALNLDGGGSSTMVARGGRGKMRVLNTPSDGFQRRVANALEVTYHKPGKPKKK